ncbi:MAG: rhomboid family intramembrane serine protease, partial [Chloroflexota bacterium]
GITVFVFLLQLAGPIFLAAGLWEGCPYLWIHEAYSNDIPVCYGMKVNFNISEMGEWWRLFTPMLLHGSLMHIAFNMYALRILGVSLEKFYGHWQFLLLYIVSGFAGNVASFVFTVSPSLGASTAIFGLIGAQGVFAYQNRAVFGKFAEKALRDIVMLALLNLAIGYSLAGIDNWGHVGGLIGGIVVAWYGGPMFKFEGVRPKLALVNQRDNSKIVFAGLAVMTLFAAIAGGVIAQ